MPERGSWRLESKRGHCEDSQVRGRRKRRTITGPRMFRFPRGRFAADPYGLLARFSASAIQPRRSFSAGTLER